MDKPLVHFVGIGGIGMSSLARWFLAQGYEVSGSDLTASATTKELSADGIKIAIGHDKIQVPADAKQVIFNQAIPENNPELIRARELNIPTLSYPQSVGELTKLYKTVAIAGAHGKSTTTSIVSLILRKAKFDPTVIVGTKLKEFGNRNFLEGKSDYLVIEADEWKASFLNYFPYAALITNIDREHLDFYKNLRNVKQAFGKFLQNVHPYGLVVLNKDDKNLYALKSKTKRPIVWYSLASKEAEAVKKVIKIPGLHNLSNATGAFVLCRALGVKKSVILSAISRFNGAWRRSEFRGISGGADLYDDYGHHPTEIKATLAGFREKFPDANLVCVFQPHQRERLKLLFKDFTGAFDSADHTVLLPLYAPSGRDAGPASVSSEKLSRAVEKRSGKVVPIAKSVSALKKILHDLRVTDKKTIVVMMGAGNIYEWTDKLVQ